MKIYETVNPWHLPENSLTVRWQLPDNSRTVPRPWEAVLASKCHSDSTMWHLCCGEQIWEKDLKMLKIKIYKKNVNIAVSRFNPTQNITVSRFSLVQNITVSRFNPTHNIKVSRINHTQKLKANSTRGPRRIWFFSEDPYSILIRIFRE